MHSWICNFSVYINKSDFLSNHLRHLHVPSSNSIKKSNRKDFLCRGEKNSNFPKWAGLTTIKSTLNNMNGVLTNIANNVDPTFSGDGFLNSDPVQYRQKVENLYKSYQSRYFLNKKDKLQIQIL